MLLDALRRDLGGGLATQDERGRRERLLLRLAVGAARRRLHVSYSRLEQTEARPRVPSFYALEVVRALTGSVPEPQRMEREAAAAAGARLAWPAPDDPAGRSTRSSTTWRRLRALLAGGETRGRARYLLELNDGLARSLRTRWARWHRRFTPADGLVRVTDGTRETLAAARLGARAYSASALQKFASCPYQFFLSAICRLEPRAGGGADHRARPGDARPPVPPRAGGRDARAGRGGAPAARRRRARRGPGHARPHARSRRRAVPRGSGARDPARLAGRGGVDAGRPPHVARAVGGDARPVGADRLRAGVRAAARSAPTTRAAWRPR